MDRKDELEQEIFLINKLVCNKPIRNLAGIHIKTSDEEIDYLRQLLIDRRGKAILEYNKTLKQAKEDKLFAEGRSCSNCWFADCNDPRWETPECSKGNVYGGVTRVCEEHKYRSEI